MSFGDKEVVLGSGKQADKPQLGGINVLELIDGSICASCELRLIIVTNDEEVVLRCREHPDEPQLRRVYILELIDQDVRKAALPAVAQGSILVPGAAARSETAAIPIGGG